MNTVLQDTMEKEVNAYVQQQGYDEILNIATTFNDSYDRAEVFISFKEHSTKELKLKRVDGKWTYLADCES